MPKFGTKNAFSPKFEKNFERHFVIFEISNPRIFLIAKFYQKSKMSYLGTFRLEF